MNESIAALARKVADAVASLKQTLERNQIDNLEPAIAQVQVAMDALGSYPGGADALVLAIDQLPKEEGVQIRAPPMRRPARPAPRSRPAPAKGRRMFACQS